MSRKKGNRGQTASEYALLLAVVLACFVGMQTYIKRGVQAAIRNAADDFGDQDPEAREPAKRNVVLKVYKVNLNTISASTVATTSLQDGGRTKSLGDENTPSQTVTTGTSVYRHETD